MPQIAILQRLPPGARVAIIRLRSLGDCVLTTPALRILKSFRPDLRVSIVVEERFRDIFENNPDVDRILPPGYAALRAEGPALCLNFHGGTRSALLTALSGARYRAGFGHFRNRFLYNVRIPRAQEILGEERKVHTAEHLASAMFYLGAPPGEVPRAKLAIETPGTGPNPGNANAPPASGCTTIHPGATRADKTWAAENFLRVAQALRAYGSEVVFIGGAEDDLSSFREFRVMRGAPLGEIKRLLAASSLFIGNDSGPAHMAAALGVPSVVLFGASDPAIWGPWRTPAEVLTSGDGVHGIAVGQVLDAVTRLRVHA